MRKLPKIYHVENKKINTNKEMCIVEESNNKSYKEIDEILKDVYAGLGKGYNTNLVIETDDNIYNTELIYKSREEVITKENVIIKVKDIKKIIIKK